MFTHINKNIKKFNVLLIKFFVQSLSLGLLTLLLPLTCWPIMQKVRRHLLL